MMRLRRSPPEVFMGRGLSEFSMLARRRHHAIRCKKRCEGSGDCDVYTLACDQVHLAAWKFHVLQLFNYGKSTNCSYKVHALDRLTLRIGPTHRLTDPQ